MVCARRLRFKRGLLGGVMAWQGSVPAFPDGMTGQPIWSLHWRVRSERRTIGGSTSRKIRNGVEPCDGAPVRIKLRTRISLKFHCNFERLLEPLLAAMTGYWWAVHCRTARRSTHHTIGASLSRQAPKQKWRPILWPCSENDHREISNDPRKNLTRFHFREDKTVRIVGPQ